ncbi:PAP2 superfamily protein [Streptomyces sp. S4.7]|uniref:phosphatase PAP2 family protein n=1 Tax=Streptomyces sp. S4.7 TaxID=2705439 RepID=UPI0013992388|nr:phosphatase PAP2 family protein [Streptomyces sp. S4.7]QHY94022.1 PAP2 superfamily protein [Streptomyces sp. S4.7]
MQSPAVPPAPRPASPAPSTPPGPVTTARVGAVLGVASLILLALVAPEWGPLLTLDRTVAVDLHRWAVAEPGLTHANRILTGWVWDPWTMRLLTAVAFFVLWFRRERLLACWVALTSLVGALVSQGLKAAVGRERPSWPDPVDSAHFAAFPSGHAMTAAVTVGTLLWLLRRHGVSGPLWRVALVVGVVSVLGVGFTRVWLGVHWSSDVVAGWLFGACLVALSVATYEGRALSRWW